MQIAIGAPCGAPCNLRTTIAAKLTHLAANPLAPNNNVKALQGEPGFRLRVGDWRVIYRLDDGQLVVLVIRIAPRGDACRQEDAMKPQVIEQDGKPAFVVVPWEEWLRVSRLAGLARKSDEALFRDGMASLAAGEETFPLELVMRLDDENRVKVFRDHRGQIQAQLAKAAGIAPAYLAQIEQGVRKGSLSTLRKLATALKVDVELVLPREEG